MQAKELIEFLLWAEQVNRPHLLRLCEYYPRSHYDLDGSEYNPILQTLSAVDHTPLGNDSAGQAGIISLVEQFNDWQERRKVGKAQELTAVIVDEDNNTGC